MTINSSTHTNNNPVSNLGDLNTVTPVPLPAYCYVRVR